LVAVVCKGEWGESTTTHNFERERTPREKKREGNLE